MKQLISRLRRPNKQDGRVITVVSGLPRSGTSMMMKMLAAGGMSILTDEIREADVDNPKGYYEFERVKQLDKGDHEWLDDAQGKVVKIISALLEHLPPDQSYRVIFMQRQIEEILTSQKKMLVRRGEPTDRVSDEELARLFTKHLQNVQTWLQTQPNFQVLYVDYNQMIASPQPLVQQVNAFLGDVLDEERMLATVDPALYRNRA